MAPSAGTGAERVPGGSSDAVSGQVGPGGHDVTGGPATLPTLGLITGMPGAGKTTLACALAGQMHVPLVCRDEIKELIADALVGEKETVPSVGPWHFRVFWGVVRVLLQTSPLVLAETATLPDLVGDDLRSLPPAIIRIVHLDVPTSLANERYRRRALAGTRHAVHDDLARADLMLDNPDMYAGYGQPPEIPNSAPPGSGIVRVSGAKAWSLEDLASFLTASKGSA